MRFIFALDGVAALRDRSGSRTPDPLAVALLAELAGVDGVGVHLWRDRRASLERDLRLLRESISTRLDVGIPPGTDLVATAFDARPDRVTLVPDRRTEGRAVGGLDVHVLKDALRKHVVHLRDADIEVAVRIEPDLDQVKALRRLDADVAFLESGALGEARTARERRTALARLMDAASTAARANLRVAVGGGLDLRDVEEVAHIPQVDEIHVGHGCLARAVLVGMDRAVRDFVAAIDRGSQRAR